MVAMNMRLLNFLPSARLPFVAALLSAALIGCSTATIDKEGRVYHCVDLAPASQPNGKAKLLPLEQFAYGDYVRNPGPAISGGGICTFLRLPRTAYIRYRVDGRVVERTLDLSSLTPQRVANNRVLFYVNDDHVEVLLLSPKLTRSQGDLEPKREIITRQ